MTEDDWAERLETTFVHLCKYGGALKSLIDMERNHPKIRDEREAVVMSTLREAVVASTVLSITKCVFDPDGTFQQLKKHIGEVGNDDPEKELSDKFKELEKDAVLRRICVARSEVVAHDTWRTGSIKKKRYEGDGSLGKGSPYVAPRPSEIVASVETITVVCGEAYSLLFSSDRLSRSIEFDGYVRTTKSLLHLIELGISTRETFE